MQNDKSKFKIFKKQVSNLKFQDFSILNSNLL